MIFYRKHKSPGTAPKGGHFNVAPDAIRLLFGGDVNFDPPLWERTKIPVGVETKRSEECGPIVRGALRVMRAVSQCLGTGLSRFQLINKILFRYQQMDLALTELRINVPTSKRDNAAGTTRHRVNDPGTRKVASPFERVKPLLKQMDFVSVNLETPLADDRARRFGLFKSDPVFAQVMAEAGISLANLANNHIFDALEEGLSQTIRHLEQARIDYCGYGRDVDQARAGRTISIKGTRFAFLGYTQYCNTRYASIAGHSPGILPLDRQVMIEDITRARGNADFVLVNVHWGIEDQPSIQAMSVTLAHECIENGADAVIGHHPHVPHGIEIYRGKPVVYSLGNFVFGAGYDLWTDNMLVEIVIHQQRIQGLRIYPISGKSYEVRRPEVLTGERANTMLQDVAQKSAELGTSIEIRDGVGYVAIAS